ncbi:pleckstrin homology domain-containing family B member 1 isoform X1 [Neopelma chrysocephalum]|uniref:pleckstrin homology domain-containing family B member 1 isoform X1 n=1 Tax=Neopelma chrysocephalum TaxID=114329 RepID=UPI000FCD3D54|nr:pleckstrin homology domain-containing family B member 1 isoform X1 [Neopelma chrysocephalum]
MDPPRASPAAPSPPREAARAGFSGINGWEAALFPLGRRFGMPGPGLQLPAIRAGGKGRAAGAERSASRSGDPTPPPADPGHPGAAMALVKSGWLWRQSSILRRWKRNWFVLYLDGSLVYYHDETQRDMDGRIHIKYSCRDVRIGRECKDVQPPEGRSRECLLTVVLRDGSKTTLCAESQDDAVAWKMAVLEAKSTPVHVYDPYDDDYYQTVPLDSHQAAYISSGHYGHQYGGPGVTHVIVREDPYRVSGDQMALGLLAGAATGAALGSFMWMPCWF